MKKEVIMDNKSNFRRGSVELLVLHLLNQKDYYGYELSQTIKEQSDSVLNIPVGSLYPALYKLIDSGYISDYKKQVGRRLIRVYYHIEDSGIQRLSTLIEDYNSTVAAVQQVLNYKPKNGDIIDD
jgi:PadR family transcriptional regulator PadR